MADQCHCIGMDCETAGLEPGCEIYVISLYDTRNKSVHNFVSDGETDKHIINATLFMDQSIDPICTFNGTSFDFKMMAFATNDLETKQKLSRLALLHVDIMLQFACDQGYFSSLASFAIPTLNKEKIGSGGAVNEQWKEGLKKEVIDYCADDAKLTSDLYTYGSNYGRLFRLSKTKNKSTWVLPLKQRWKCAAECLQNIKIPDFIAHPPNIKIVADWTLDYLK